MQISCIIVDDDKMSVKIVKNFIEQTGFIKLLNTFSNAITAAKFINDPKSDQVDLIFLDIEMPEMSGMDFLKTFEKLPQIILITSREQHALEAFEYKVTDYLLKPLTYSRFLKAVNRVKEIHEGQQSQSQAQQTPGTIVPAAQQNSNNKYIFVKQSYNLVKINTENILYIEALGDYITINTDKEKMTIHSTMKGIESKLPHDKFLRVHRSFIVSIDNIEKVDLDDGLLVVDKKLIPIGISYKEGLMKRINTL